MDIQQRTRTNAAIAYCFLGPLFLLSRRNPNFSDPFVRKHASAASKTIGIYAGIFFGYSHFLSQYFAFPLPIFPIMLDRLVSVAILALFLFVLMRGAFRAHAGKNPASIWELPFFQFQEISFKGENLTSETDKTLALLSFIPIVGIVIAGRKPSEANTLGARAGSVFFLFSAFSIITSGDASHMVLTLLYTAYFVAVGFSIFTSGNIPAASILARIPSLEVVYRIVRTIPEFTMESLRIIFGKESELSFIHSYRQVEIRDRSSEATMEEVFSETTFPISPKLIAIPGVNILFIPKVFSSSPYRYSLAAGQGIAMTVLYILSVLYGDFSTPYQVGFIPAIALLLANIEKRPFYRVPVLYECSSLVGIFTFGLANRARKIREVSKKETSVSFKA